MPSYSYTHDDEHYYPTLGLNVEPGDTVEADENPDPPNFEEADGTSAADQPVDGLTDTDTGSEDPAEP